MESSPTVIGGGDDKAVVPIDRRGLCDEDRSMIDWLLMNHHYFVRASRWIVMGCAAALLGFASLSPTPVNRIIALAGIAAVGLVFLIWLVIALVTIFRPRIFVQMRQRRANRRR